MKVLGILMFIAGNVILIKEKIDHPRKYSSSGCLMPSLGFLLVLLGAGLISASV